MPAAENASSKTYSKSATGLHFDDIEKLLASFRALLDRGTPSSSSSTTPTSSMPPTTSSSSGPNAVSWRLPSSVLNPQHIDSRHCSIKTICPLIPTVLDRRWYVLLSQPSPGKGYVAPLQTGLRPDDVSTGRITVFEAPVPVAAIHSIPHSDENHHP